MQSIPLVEDREVRIMNVGQVAAIKVDSTKDRIQNMSAKENHVDARSSADVPIPEKVNLIESDKSELSSKGQVASVLLSQRLSSEFKVSVGIIDQGGQSSSSQDSTDEISVSEADPNRPEKYVNAEVVEGFDFEKVANNVLAFVSNSIQQRFSQGASQDELKEKLEQAKNGVQRGFEGAMSDLDGLIDKSLKQSIGKSQDLVENGLTKLENQYILPNESSIDLSAQAYSKSNTGSFIIETADGDQVSINFERNFAQSKLQLQLNEGDELLTQSSILQTSNSQFDISISGELDGAELKAVHNLLEDAEKIANQFFYSDIESAYQTATELGFDSEKLAGFALQLRQTESSSQLRQYDEIQNNSLSNKTQGPNEPKVIAEYMNKMLDALENTQQVFGEEQKFKSIINGLINEMEDVQVPDLISAINRFHSFNSKLSSESMQLN